MVKHYPHTAILSFVGIGTFNSVIGVWAEGTTTTIGFICNIQPNTRHFSIIGDDGVVIPYTWAISCPLDSRLNRDDIPDGANLTFFNKDHIIKLLNPYQYHVEILC